MACLQCLRNMKFGRGVGCSWCRPLTQTLSFMESHQFCNHVRRSLKQDEVSYSEILLRLSCLHTGITNLFCCLISPYSIMFCHGRYWFVFFLASLEDLQDLHAFCDASWNKAVIASGCSRFAILTRRNLQRWKVWCGPVVYCMVSDLYHTYHINHISPYMIWFNCPNLSRHRTSGRATGQMQVICGRRNFVHASAVPKLQRCDFEFAEVWRKKVYSS